MHSNLNDRISNNYLQLGLLTEIGAFINGTTAERYYEKALVENNKNIRAMLGLSRIDYNYSYYLDTVWQLDSSLGIVEDHCLYRIYEHKLTSFDGNGNSFLTFNDVDDSVYNFKMLQFNKGIRSFYNAFLLCDKYYKAGLIDSAENILEIADSAILATSITYRGTTYPSAEVYVNIDKLYKYYFWKAGYFFKRAKYIECLEFCNKMPRYYIPEGITNGKNIEEGEELKIRAFINLNKIDSAYNTAVVNVENDTNTGMFDHGGYCVLTYKDANGVQRPSRVIHTNGFLIGMIYEAMDSLVQAIEWYKIGVSNAIHFNTGEFYYTPADSLQYIKLSYTKDKIYRDSIEQSLRNCELKLITRKPTIKHN